MTGAIRGSATPRAWWPARAGLVRGPRKLNTVGTPSSRRGTAAWRKAGWNTGAKQNPMLTSSMVAATPSGGRAIATPRPSSRSALPQRLERRGHGQHGLDQAGDLGGGLALDAQGGGEGGDLGRGGLTGQHRAHGRAGLLLAEVLTAQERPEHGGPGEQVGHGRLPGSRRCCRGKPNRLGQYRARRPRTPRPRPAPSRDREPGPGEHG